MDSHSVASDSKTTPSFGCFSPTLPPESEGNWGWIYGVLKNRYFLQIASCYAHHNRRSSVWNVAEIDQMFKVGVARETEKEGCNAKQK